MVRGTCGRCLDRAGGGTGLVVFFMTVVRLDVAKSAYMYTHL